MDISPANAHGSLHNLNNQTMPKQSACSQRPLARINLYTLLFGILILSMTATLLLSPLVSNDTEISATVAQYRRSSGPAENRRNLRPVASKKLKDGDNDALSLPQRNSKEEKEKNTAQHQQQQQESQLGGRPKDICSALLRPSSSPNMWWRQLSDQVLASSLVRNDTSDLRSLKKSRKLKKMEQEVDRFNDWVKGLWRFYDESNKWQRSTMMPANPGSMQRILEILLKDSQSREDLHIWVSGGSVTAGHECRYLSKEIIGTDKSRRPEFQSRGNQADLDCAWPARLEQQLNSVLGVWSHRRVRVTNLAVGGVSSETAAVALKYGLFHNRTKEIHPPDLVLLAHAANDVRNRNVTESVDDHLQDLIRVAKDLPGNPLVMLIDDFSGSKLKGDRNLVYNAAHMSGDLYALASWHQIPAVALPPMIRPSIFGGSNDKPDHSDPILASKIALHSGMGLHISMAWAVLYNIIQGLVQACETRERLNGAANTDQRKYDMPRPSEPDSQFIPAWKNDTTPVSYTKEYRDQKRKFYQQQQQLKDSRHHHPCMYGWMVSESSGVGTAEDVSRMIEPHIVPQTNNGKWLAMGKPTSRPRPGWYAKAPEAKFDMQMPVTQPTEYLTLVTMKSNGPAFLNSMLEVEIIVQSAAGIVSSSVELIDGRHEPNTSIHVPTQIKLPAKAHKGDSIRLRFHLVGGKFFEINGMALCER